MSLDEMSRCDSSTVSYHPNEPMPSKVPQHLKGFKIRTAPRRRKEKIMFRERNGAAYQVPDNWEELYEEEKEKEISPTLSYADKQKRAIGRKYASKASVNSDVFKNKETRKGSDYYTEMQKMISAEIRAAHDEYSSYDNTANTKSSRWNKKHQAEIESDKSTLRTWVENGIVCRAFAPRCDASPKTDIVMSNYDCEFKGQISREITLGDFMPKNVIKSADEITIDSVDAKGDSYPYLPNPDEIREQKKKASDHKKRFSATRKVTEEEDESYRSCDECPEHTEDKFAQLTKDVISNLYSLGDDHDTINEIFEVWNNRDPELHAASEIERIIRKKIPLCIHGILYQAKHFNNSLFREAELMLEVLPRKRLSAFSEAVKKLAASVEILRCSYLNRKLYGCREEYCRWRYVEVSDDQLHEKSIFTPSLVRQNDLITFEVKLAMVDSPRYRLKTLMQDTFSPLENGRYTDYHLSAKYKKALEMLESHKSKGLRENVDQFVNMVFREVFILMESLPEEESKSLRKSIAAFNDATWRMRELEDEDRREEKSSCCGLFRSRERRRRRVSSSLDSDFSVTDQETELSESVIAKAVQATLEQCAAMRANVNSPEQCHATVTAEYVIPPKQSSPTVMVQYNSLEWQSHSGGSENELQDPTFVDGSATFSVVEQLNKLSINSCEMPVSDKINETEGKQLQDS